MDGFQPLCSASDIPTGGRGVFLHPVDGTRVVVFRSGDQQFYAIAARCYHMGGPLERGEVLATPETQVNGHSCIVCPFHRYVISLETGECFYRPAGELGGWRSKGKRQRIYRIVVHGEMLFISNDDPSGVASCCSYDW